MGSDSPERLNEGGRAVLAVEGLAVELGRRRVLEGVDLGVAAGELVTLVGPNGAGKTTLLRAALGLVKPVAGRVSVAGRDPAAGRAAVGYVPQRHEFAWDFPIAVADAVMTGLVGKLGLGRRPGRAEWQAVADALARVELAELADRPVGQLSGGQRQRVLVARALAPSPALLLADEPFTGLDLPTQGVLSALFRGLAREGRAVLMTTHDLLAALDGSDRLALLNRTLVAVGTPAELAARPQAWTEAFEVGPDSPLLRALAGAAATGTAAGAAVAV
ncbi:MAG: anchored repeat-type ABC transporter ATP-binding subunit [Bifidobacteriaceae bacterium]|jgi:manganese/iron transport system ATP-binding protein|nr:anchored repeat-type ABC transporter ATP-binding subunit [Bifidobacteriaceae bacterium]